MSHNTQTVLLGLQKLYSYSVHNAAAEAVARPIAVHRAACVTDYLHFIRGVVAHLGRVVRVPE
jgi:hypothetical protein